MLDWIVILLSAALSILLPVAIIYVRQTVKTQRRDVISDLAVIFEPRQPDIGHDQIIPSFDFVKFKYSVPDPSHAAGQEHLLAAAIRYEPAHRYPPPRKMALRITTKDHR